jgi:hypothetical protein
VKPWNWVSWRGVNICTGISRYIFSRYSTLTFGQVSWRQADLFYEQKIRPKDLMLLFLYSSKVALIGGAADSVSPYIGQTAI